MLVVYPLPPPSSGFWLGSGNQLVKGLIPHSFQPSFFSITSRLPWVSEGVLERFGFLERMEMEGTLSA